MALAVRELIQHMVFIYFFAQRLVENSGKCGILMGFRIRVSTLRALSPINPPKKVIIIVIIITVIIIIIIIVVIIIIIIIIITTIIMAIQLK